MKKTLVLLASLVLLLTSCINDNDSPEPLGDEVYLYNNVMSLQSDGQQISLIVDQYAKRYVDNEVVPEMTVVDNGNGTFVMTFDFSNHENPYSYRGTLTVNITGTTPASDDAVKTIDVSELKTIDAQATFAHNGLIKTTGMPTGDPDVLEQQIEYLDFGMLLNNATAPFISFSNYSYQFKHTGLTTAKTDDDKFYWSGGYGHGTHYKYGQFSVMMDIDLEKVATLSYFTKGRYTMAADELGSIASPIVVEFCKDGAGTLTITYQGKATTHRVS